MSTIKKEQDMTNEKQIERLTTHVYVNPYEVLMLGPEASEEEIKKQYKQVRGFFTLAVSDGPP